MKKYNRIAGLFLIAVGLATGFHSWWNLKLGSWHRPDSGFLPFFASLLLIICSAVWTIENLGKDEKAEPFFEGQGWVRPALSLLLMVLYGLAFEPVGYLISTLLFMLAWQLIIEKEKWLKSGLIAVISMAAMWLVFSKFLTVPLPAGLLDLLS